jgi:hypothetical protein
MDKPETNVVDKHWLSNKQVLGLSGVLIAMGIGYGEFQTMKANDKIHAIEIENIKERARKEEGEMKALVYTKARENNEKTGRMVNPLRKDIEELKAWMNYEKGLEDGRRRK